MSLYFCPLFSWNSNASIIYYAGENNTAQIAICNLFGQEVFKKKLAMAGGQEDIEVRDFAQGMYIVKLTDQNGKTLLNTKLIITK